MFDLPPLERPRSSRTIAGSFVAAQLPVWLTFTLAIAEEHLLLATIRDNLTLNVVMLYFHSSR